MYENICIVIIVINLYRYVLYSYICNILRPNFLPSQAKVMTTEVGVMISVAAVKPMVDIRTRTIARNTGTV